MDSLQYTRMLAQDAKKMTDPPKLLGMSLYHAVISIGKAHPWRLQHDAIPGALKVKRVIYRNWTVSTCWIELFTEDGGHWQITSWPFPYVTAPPLGYLHLERITP